MRRSNFDLSTALVAIGAVAVLISLFLDWYGDPGLSAFDAFEVTDWLLVALAVGALVVIATETWSGGGAPSNRLAWICGLLTFLVIAQLLDPPPIARDADREIGAWLALGGSALMVVGAVLAMAEISVTIDVAERERRRRTAAVDARADEDAAAASDATPRAGGRGSGLWQAPATPDAAPPPPDAQSSTPKPKPKAKAAAPPAATAAAQPGPPKPADPPADDPDRTQPLRPLDRPDGDGAA